eukprot:CAMPEP_0202100860 /NCGR_PEP_ID=MMETSP0965-20130614/3390_1 /ASSEMBLY_ACC=CAM_ASM_000507 /TAXON_ID=4773 /ORGANISM="Schizochytrium aggregatum, Strain ATCC28209" /LENGTH=55 /DNA_ID=CAMNT_0048669539 /DNA_START=68 /DNA_END=232 /DNA_ORIENTATION=+
MSRSSWSSSTAGSDADEVVAPEDDAVDAVDADWPDMVLALSETAAAAAAGAVAAA